jgi:hypothetical protein
VPGRTVPPMIASGAMRTPGPRLLTGMSEGFARGPGRGGDHRSASTGSFGFAGRYTTAPVGGRSRISQ